MSVFFFVVFDVFGVDELLCLCCEILVWGSYVYFVYGFVSLLLQVFYDVFDSWLEVEWCWGVQCVVEYFVEFLLVVCDSVV